MYALAHLTVRVGRYGRQPLSKSPERLVCREEVVATAVDVDADEGLLEQQHLEDLQERGWRVQDVLREHEDRRLGSLHTVVDEVLDGEPLVLLERLVATLARAMRLGLDEHVPSQRLLEVHLGLGGAPGTR